MGKYTGMSFEKAFGMEKFSFDSSRSKSPKRDNAKHYRDYTIYLSRFHS